jgi:hypothetical protein
MIYKNKLTELLEQKAKTSNEGLEVAFSSKGGASAQDIMLLNEYFNLKLPDEYISFLLAYNGLELYKHEDVGGFLFFCTGNLIEENGSLKKEYGLYWDNSIILFCQIIGEGNFLGFRIQEDGKYGVVDCFHELPPREWETIETSFDACLDKLLKNNGEKYWLIC